MKDTDLTIFEDYNIRRVYDEKREIWCFSVIDIIQVLIQQKDYQLARNYWKVLKNRLSKEGSQVVTNCNRLKLPAEDGRMRLTDVADTETLLRLIQSVPSPGGIAKNARLELEEKTGKKVVSDKNYLRKKRDVKKLK